MKKTKRLFITSFFGCFALPLMIVLFATLSMVVQTPMIVAFSDWIMNAGGIWILVVYEIIVILITVMLGLTIRLKNIEYVSVEDVEKGTISDRIVKKVGNFELKVDIKPSTKNIKGLEKRDLTFTASADTTPAPTAPNKNSTGPNKKPEKQQPMFSAIKK